jgi:predicted acyl esterase
MVAFLAKLREPLYRRYIGPNGRLRASHREVTEETIEGISQEEYRKLMSPAYVYHPHTSKQPLLPGEIVELEISLWPGGMVFDAGDSMSLEIKGRLPILPEFEGLEERLVSFNVGRHKLHTGPYYGSQLFMSLREG